MFGSRRSSTFKLVCNVFGSRASSGPSNPATPSSREQSTMTTDTAVGYVRLSQQSDRSLAAQREDIEAYCAREGPSLGEGASGYDNERKHYSEMLADIRTATLPRLLSVIFPDPPAIAASGSGSCSISTRLVSDCIPSSLIGPSI